MEQTLRERLDSRYAALDLERQSWIPHWRDLSELILPRRGRFLWNEANDGRNKYNKIILLREPKELLKYWKK